ncbi:hypothetical protein QE152_g8051 [Popillia japonica]|uniref:Reverse transcriptase n=1 Tax=Popillia japonica TaxID=7064 RepID=A0AAW1ME48_POPJA
MNWKTIFKDTTGKVIADKFVSHFCEPIRDALCCNNQLFDDYMTTRGRITSNTQVQSFCLPDVTSQEVDDIIRQLDVKKATGADGVMTSDVIGKKFSHLINYAIKRLINLSVQSSYFPEDLNLRPLRLFLREAQKYTQQLPTHFRTSHNG